MFDCVHAMPGSFLQRVCLWDPCGGFVLLMYMLMGLCVAYVHVGVSVLSPLEDYEVAKGAQLLFLYQCSMHLTFGNYLLLTSGG